MRANVHDNQDFSAGLVCFPKFSASYGGTSFGLPIAIANGGNPQDKKGMFISRKEYFYLYDLCPYSPGGDEYSQHL